MAKRKKVKRGKKARRHGRSGAQMTDEQRKIFWDLNQRARARWGLDVKGAWYLIWSSMLKVSERTGRAYCLFDDIWEEAMRTGDAMFAAFGLPMREQARGH